MISRIVRDTGQTLLVAWIANHRVASAQLGAPKNLGYRMATRAVGAFGFEISIIRRLSTDCPVGGMARLQNHDQWLRGLSIAERQCGKQRIHVAN